MIPVRGTPFTAAARAPEGAAPGPVFRVSLTFEEWFDGQPLEADAFLDTGADRTILSMDWCVGQWKKAGEKGAPYPQTAHSKGIGLILLERMTVDFGGVKVRLASDGITRGTRLYRQAELPDVSWHHNYNKARRLEGFDDLIIGRDLLSQASVLVVVDSADSTLTALFPCDRENATTREQVLSTLGVE